MARYIGPRSVLDAIYAVGGMDASTLLDWQNTNSVNAEQVINTLAGAVGDANEAAYNRWSPFFFVTETMDKKYRDGSTARKTPKDVEFAQQESIRGSESGHMLPIDDFRDKLAWSWQYLRDAFPSQFDADIQEIVDSWFLRVDSDMINRLFSISATAVGGGYSLPFVDASAAGSVTYTPPSYGAKNFDSTHTHFTSENAAATAAKFKTHLETRVTHLREHGIGGRLVCLISEADVETWSDVTGFVALVPTDIQYVTGGGSAVQVAPGEFEGMAGTRMGYVNTKRGYVELRYMEQIPTGYFCVTRSYGDNNANNPLAVRLHPTTPFGLMPDVMVNRSMTPRIESVEVYATHGVGINNRLNGALAVVKTGASSYSWTNI